MGVLPRAENKEAISVYQTYVDVYSWLQPGEMIVGTWGQVPSQSVTKYMEDVPHCGIFHRQSHRPLALTRVPQTHPLYCLSSFQLSWDLGGRLWLCHSPVCVTLNSLFPTWAPASHSVKLRTRMNQVSWVPPSLDISGVCRRPSLFRSGKLENMSVSALTGKLNELWVGAGNAC